MIRLTLVAAFTAALTPACGPELASSVALASSEGTSGNGNDNTSEEDQTAWLVVTAIVAVTSVVALVSALSGDDLFAYMQEHQLDVRRALASGQGPFPSDLAQSLGLPASEVPRVARILREGRPWLAPCVDEGPVSQAGVREFWGQLLLLLAADPVTRPRLERLEQRAFELVGGS